MRGVFSWATIAVLFAAVIYLLVRTSRPLFRYQKAAKRGGLKKMQGRVSRFVGTESKTVKGQTITMAYPVYSFVVSGSEKEVQSAVKYRNVPAGAGVEIEYDERTGEAWATKDIPLMKKGLKIRTGMFGILFLAMILIELLR